MSHLSHLWNAEDGAEHPSQTNHYSNPVGGSISPHRIQDGHTSVEADGYGDVCRQVQRKHLETQDKVT